MDHLLVMPVTPFEIAMSKVWANGLVITLAVGLSLNVIVRALLGIPVAGSVVLFLAGVMIYLFFAAAIGIFLATVARTMPQLGLLYLLVATPMNILSGQYAARKHAAAASNRHAGVAFDPFRVLRSGDSLPRRWPRRGVARVLGRRAWWRTISCARLATLSSQCGGGNVKKIQSEGERRFSAI
jgi:ABC-type multidrug transport system permease subunit